MIFVVPMLVALIGMLVLRFSSQWADNHVERESPPHPPSHTHTYTPSSVLIHGWRRPIQGPTFRGEEAGVTVTSRLVVARRGLGLWHTSFLVQLGTGDWSMH